MFGGESGTTTSRAFAQYTKTVFTVLLGNLIYSCCRYHTRHSPYLHPCNGTLPTRSSQSPSRARCSPRIQSHPHPGRQKGPPIHVRSYQGNNALSPGHGLCTRFLQVPSRTEWLPITSPWVSLVEQARTIGTTGTSFPKGHYCCGMRML